MTMPQGDEAGAESDFRSVTLPVTDRSVAARAAGGAAQGRFYVSAGATRGVIWVGGVGGDWDTPAQGLYPRLAADLTRVGIASLRVRFRHSTNLAMAVADVMAGIAFLHDQGMVRLGLVGHSFGGAVVIEAASRSPLVRTVVTLATQSYGAGAASRLGPRCALLLVHGLEDMVLPYSASVHVHADAAEPKRLILLDGAGHNLDEAADRVHAETRAWLLERL